MIRLFLNKHLAFFEHEGFNETNVFNQGGRTRILFFVL